jgi:hypothetical protein
MYRITSTYQISRIRNVFFNSICTTRCTFSYRCSRIRNTFFNTIGGTRDTYCSWCQNFFFFFFFLVNAMCGNRGNFHTYCTRIRNFALIPFAVLQVPFLPIVRGFRIFSLIQFAILTVPLLTGCSRIRGFFLCFQLRYQKCLPTVNLPLIYGSRIFFDSIYGTRSAYLRLFLIYGSRIFFFDPNYGTRSAYLPFQFSFNLRY